MVYVGSVFLAVTLAFLTSSTTNNFLKGLYLGIWKPIYRCLSNVMDVYVFLSGDTGDKVTI